MSILKRLNDASSYAVSAVRVGHALGATEPCRELPERTLELYEFESCPYCRKVRETLSALNIDYISRSSARGSKKRQHVEELGGKAQFPLLIDPNTGTSMYESEDIIDYLQETYGKTRHFCWRLLSPLNTLGSSLASVARPRGGSVKNLRRTQDPEELLELYNMEVSPYCRKVREVLCELDLDCHIKNTTLHGPLREELLARGGRKTVPYLADPNTGIEMYESDDIVDYLRETYG